MSTKAKFDFGTGFDTSVAPPLFPGFVPVEIPYTPLELEKLAAEVEAIREGWRVRQRRCRERKRLDAAAIALREMVADTLAPRLPFADGEEVAQPLEVPSKSRRDERELMDDLDIFRSVINLFGAIQLDRKLAKFAFEEVDGDTIPSLEMRLMWAAARDVFEQKRPVNRDTIMNRLQDLQVRLFHGDSWLDGLFETGLVKRSLTRAEIELDAYRLKKEGRQA